MAETADAEIDAAARAKADGLRRIKYRLILIFLLLPGLLVAAIVFDWLWEQNLSARLTRTWVIGIYGGLIVAFGVASCVIGYFVRKRMRREEEAEMAAAKSASKPVGMRSRR